MLLPMDTAANKNEEILSAELMKPIDGNENIQYKSMKTSVLKSKSHKRKLRQLPLKVRFDDNIVVNEYESVEWLGLTEEEIKKNEDIIKNMFLEEDDKKKLEVDENSEKVSSWFFASTVISASRRLAMFAKSSISTSTDENLTKNDLDERESTNPQNYVKNSNNLGFEFSRFSLRGWFQGASKRTANTLERTVSDPSAIDNKFALERKKTLCRSESDSAVDNRKAFFEELENIVYQAVRSEKTDPYQFFEVKQEFCHHLRVRVICGRNISKGQWQDIIDTPDPYVVIHIKEAPSGRKTTKPRDNEVNPVWNEELNYLLPMNLEENITAEIYLMDSNYSMDELYGTVKFNISALPLDTTVKKSFLFNQTSEVDMEFFLEVKRDNDLRFSLALCDDEKAFRSARFKIAQNAMRKLLHGMGLATPREPKEVPVIAVIGSGGGFRAMTGFSGALKALYNTGILDCVTYACGLSGSSWYLATLYAHEDFPSKGTDAANAEIRNNIQTNPFWLLHPQCLMRFSNRLRQKMRDGQPVTLTDLFGMLIGQTLLGKKKMNLSKLSDFVKKIEGGKAPMPLMTCLHVRPKISALTFHDWVEFTPFEIGMAKYGAFMQTRHFGNKFYKGVLARQFDESPLYFLMGIWGSAFSILFNRLVDRSKDVMNDVSKTDDIRKELEEELSSEINEKEEDSDLESESDVEEDGDKPIESKQISEVIDSDDDDDDEFEDARDSLLISQVSKQKKPNIFSNLWNWGADKEKRVTEETMKENKNEGGIFKTIFSSVFGNGFLESREYRAGKVLNYMRGLSLNHSYPISPFSQKSNSSTIAEEGEFKQIHEPIEVNQKRVHLVDAGLTFNSPYPPILRPQRAVDLIISFDFSARPEENFEPFKELLLAEKWAKLHNLPFPKIDRTVYEREGLKECYVFKDDENEHAPTIIHFVLCNLQFRKHSKPGVLRAPNDNEGNFDVFGNSKTPYSTFNFQYSNQTFDRLHRLMEFNTLLHVDTILREIANCVSLRRRSKSRGSLMLEEIRKSIYLTAKSRESLEKAFINQANDAGRIFVD